MDAVAAAPTAHELTLAARLLRLRFDRWGLDLNTRRSLSSEVPLVVLCPPVVLEPVNQGLERRVVRLVEVETSWSHLDEFFEDFVARNVTQHDVLWVSRQNGKSVRNPAGVFLLFLLQAGFKVLKRLGIRELLVTNNLSHKPVARNDVALDDFSQTLELVVVADGENAADSCSWLLVALVDVDVHVVVFPEFPRERDAIFTASRRSEEEVTCLQQIQFGNRSS